MCRPDPYVFPLMNVISGVLTDAVDDDLISVNPTLNLGRRFMKKVYDAIEARKVANGDENEEPIL